MDLSLAIIRAKHDLKEKIKEIRSVVPIPPYIVSSILSEIQNELKDEEKELLTIMILEAENKAEAKESDDNAEDIGVYDNRESNQE